MKSASLEKDLYLTLNFPKFYMGVICKARKNKCDLGFLVVILGLRGKSCLKIKKI